MAEKGHPLLTRYFHSRLSTYITIYHNNYIATAATSQNSLVYERSMQCAVHVATLVEAIPRNGAEWNGGSKTRNGQAAPARRH